MPTLSSILWHQICFRKRPYHWPLVVPGLSVPCDVLALHLTGISIIQRRCRAEQYNLYTHGSSNDDGSVTVASTIHFFFFASFFLQETFFFSTVVLPRNSTATDRSDPGTGSGSSLLLQDAKTSGPPNELARLECRRQAVPAPCAFPSIWFLV